MAPTEAPEPLPASGQEHRPEHRIYTHLHGVIFPEYDLEIARALGELPARVVFNAQNARRMFSGPDEPSPYRLLTETLRADSYLDLDYPPDVNRRLEAVYSQTKYFGRELDGRTAKRLSRIAIGKVVWIDPEADKVNYNCRGLSLLKNPDFMAVKTDADKGLVIGQIAEIADFLAA